MRGTLQNIQKHNFWPVKTAKTLCTSSRRFVWWNVILTTKISIVLLALKAKGQKYWMSLVIYYWSLNSIALENNYRVLPRYPISLFAIDCGESPLSVHTDDSCLTMKPVPRYQTTVGSTIKFACASLLTSIPVSHISYCPVQTCLENSTWSNVSLSCARKYNNLDLERIRDDLRFVIIIIFKP